LWKAQRAFISAEILWKEHKHDCAANRYYYAIYHLGRAYIGEVPNVLAHDLLLKRLKQEDEEAYRTGGKALMQRIRADYTPHSVKRGDISRFREAEARAICRAMTRFKVDKRGEA